MLILLDAPEAAEMKNRAFEAPTTDETLTVSFPRSEEFTKTNIVPFR